MAHFQSSGTFGNKILNIKKLSLYLAGFLPSGFRLHLSSFNMKFHANEVKMLLLRSPQFVKAIDSLGFNTGRWFIGHQDENNWVRKLKISNLIRLTSLLAWSTYPRKGQALTNLPASWLPFITSLVLWCFPYGYRRSKKLLSYYFLMR